MGIFDPQGIPSSPTSQTTTNTGIAAWAQPYVSNMLTQAQNLANQGTTPFQNQVYGAAANMQTPGQFAEGSNLLNQAGAGMLGTTGTALGYGQQASGAGQAYQQMATDPSQMQQWMNPYIQQALNPQLALLNQQQALQGQGIAAKAAGQGAFGGNRATLAQGLNAQNYALAQQQAVGQGYNEAFRQAQQAQQFRSELGLRGLQAALQGVDTAQRGYAGATQAGVGLGNIGAQQGQYDVSRLGLQNQIANQQYNLPYQRLQFMQGMLSGLPISTSTTQGYQAGPNKAAQMAGLVGTVGTYGKDIWNTGKNVWDWATGGGGGGGGIPYGGDARDIGLSETALSGASYADLPYDLIATGGQIKDGGVKRYAEGGITSINRRVMNDPTAYSAQTIDRSAQNNVLGGVTKLLALDTIAKQRAALAAQQQMQAQPQPPIVQQLAQRAGMGIDNAESNLPAQYAGGGIIAFEDGGDVSEPNNGPYGSWGKALGEWWRAHTLGTPESLQRQGTITPEQAAAAVQKQADITKQVEEGERKYSAGNLNKPEDKKLDAPYFLDDKKSGPATPAAPAFTMPPQVDRTSGIDKLIKGYEDLIRGSEDFKAAESNAETNAMRKLFLRMMANKPGSTLAQATGEAGLEAQEGLEKTQEGIQARRDKRVAQLMGLGLKGQDLKNELQKLGITEEYYRAHYPLLAAQAQYYASGKGKGVGGGKLGSATGLKLAEEYQTYKNAPASAPFFAQLPERVRLGLTKAPPGSETNRWAMGEYDKALQSYMSQKINMTRALSSGSSVDLD